MDISGWNEHYLSRQPGTEDDPTPLVTKAATYLRPGRALDFACGSGRNALWLAGQGWSVTAVDGSEAAIAILRENAASRNLKISAQVADLQAGEYPIEKHAWDLIVIAYYLQRDLFEPAKAGLRPGGILVAIVHMTNEGEVPTAHRLRPGELRHYFEGWDILHEHEGTPADPAHRHAVSELVVRLPALSPDL
jgi:SAM-dependent methyltransferase